ncbi:SRPBCC family protein [Aquimarina longa]|uniref:SRPBCC family protein n=1 Tax=Aquimarina longa TaxID=1080221 RepID=UPI0007836695|nr:SRPBCC family protein [Aquimarina longa]
MTTIHLKTLIKSPVEEVFNISRNIDFHITSAKKTKEKAIAGKTSGLIKLGETVTWRGKHFGMYLTHQSLISRYKYPNTFTDEMIRGYFKTFNHQHIFNTISYGTEMIDKLVYEVPHGVLGKLFNEIVLKKHLTKFLVLRNQAIQLYLENKNLIKKTL